MLLKSLFNVVISVLLSKPSLTQVQLTTGN
jgi:hypothetical protein